MIHQGKAMTEVSYKVTHLLSKNNKSIYELYMCNLVPGCNQWYIGKMEWMDLSLKMIWQQRENWHFPPTKQ